MYFSLFGFDFYPEENLFGFIICEITTEDIHRSLLSIRYTGCEDMIDDKWIIDLLWFRILGRGY